MGREEAITSNLKSNLKRLGGLQRGFQPGAHAYRGPAYLELAPTADRPTSDWRLPRAGGD